MTNRCGSPSTQMAKVEPRETVRKASEALARWPARGRKGPFDPLDRRYSGRIHAPSVAPNPFSGFFGSVRLRVRSSEALHSDRALLPRRRRRLGAKGEPEAQDGQLSLLGTILQWFVRSSAAYSPRDALDTSGKARSYPEQRSSASLVGLAYSPFLSPQAPFSSFPGFSAMLPSAGAASPGDPFSPSSFASAAGKSRTTLLSEVTSRTRLTGRRRSRLSVRPTRKWASATSFRSPSLSPSEPSTSAPVARSWASVWGPCPGPALRSVASVSSVSGSRSTMAALPPPSFGVLEAKMPASARS